MLKLFPWFFIAALILLIFVLPRLRAKKTHERRAKTWGAMGFAETTSEQVFADIKATARALRDFPVASISTWVGRGTSALGETVIFDFTDHLDANNFPVAYTIVGFRVNPALDDFEVRHALLLDRFAGDITAVTAKAVQSLEKDGQVTANPNTYQPPALQIAIPGNPEFDKHWRVYATDEPAASAVRSILAPDFINMLATNHFGDLNVRKIREWLFIYKEISNPTAPAKYPELLQGAVSIAQKLDMEAVSTPQAVAP